MEQLNNILQLIDGAVKRIRQTSPSRQDQLLKQILSLVKRLETRGDVLLNKIDNLKIINELKSLVERAVIDDKYRSEVKSFADAFEKVQNLHNEYFASFSAKFKTKRPTNILRKSAIESVLNNLLSSGIEIGVTDSIKRMLLSNISQGGSYADLTEQLRSAIITSKDSEGLLDRHIKTISVTSINQFSAEYNKSIADDLGLEWYMYDGSLLETSRPFCEKCCKKKYIHVSEFPTILKGDFGSLGKIGMSKTTGLPSGLIKGTNPDNLIKRRGGWNCGHQMIAVDEMIVPEDVKNKVFSTAEYKQWAKENGKEIKIREKSHLPEAIIAVALISNFYSKDTNIKKNFDEGIIEKIESETGFDYQNIINLTGGIPSGGISGIVHKRLYFGGERILSQVETDQYIIERSINLKEKSIYNELMKVKSGSKGRGIGLNLFLNQVKEARRLGFKYLYVSAAGSPEIKNMWNGYITWGKFGYKMSDSDHRNFLDTMKKNNRTETNLYQLLSTNEGSKFWEENGEGWSGNFDLSDGSESMKNLLDYLKRKNINADL